MHPNVSRAIAGGFAGTLAMTLVMYGVAPMMGLHMDIAAMLGSVLGGSWTAGLIMHFVNGSLIFPAVFTFVLYNRLPGSPTAKGTVWGVALWLMMQLIVMPMMGAGVFSSNIGGMMAAAGALVGHLLYGAALGAIAGAPQARLAHA
jgi:uncharacterized membrane protein YagU involved in acid resistance